MYFPDSSCGFKEYDIGCRDTCYDDCNDGYYGGRFGGRFGAYGGGFGRFGRFGDRRFGNCYDNYCLPNRVGDWW